MGVMNAKVGADNTNRELIMGRHGTGQQNENGELFMEFCTFNDLVIGGTIFPHKTIHKTTWTSPDVEKEPARCQGKAGSRHSIRPPPPCCCPQDQAESLQRPGRKTITQVQRAQPEREVKSRIQAGIEEQVQPAFPAARGNNRRTVAQPARHLEDNMPNSPGEENKEIQKVVDNRNMDTDHREKRTKRPDQPDSRSRREAGIANTLLGKELGNEEKEKDKRARWAEHFKETLNRPAPSVPPNIPPPTELLDINTGPPTKNEITKAIKSLKSGKAAGPDGIPPEALKADIRTSTDMLHPLLYKIWEQERVPEDWKKGHLVKLQKKGDLSSCNNWRGIMLSVHTRESTGKNHPRETEDGTGQETSR
ncbi:uncharacterized protein LOC143227481 [Tachypleus tridentatus]|uniref:uncharacterized protein LOC143227481 n=1 Tax=Tachypleus tridentatus TaxID=6853 RepID=UPI003FCFC267